LIPVFASAFSAQAAPQSIDPRALQILLHSIKTYQSLQSYQDASVNVDNAPAGKTVTRQTISFKAPRFINVVTTYGKTDYGEYLKTNNYDGVHYNSVYTTPDGGLRSQQPLPDTSYGRHVLLQYQPAGILFSPFLAGVNPLSAPFGMEISTLKLGTVTTLNHVKVDTVIATPLDDSKTHYTYLIGRKDHLVRRIIMESVTITGDKYTTTETHSNIKTNLAFPRGTFIFHIPPGVTLQKSLDEDRGDTLRTGDIAPYFHAQDLRHRSINLKQYKGKVLLVVLWATWCLPCRQEMPYLKSLYQHYKSQGFEIAGVSQDSSRTDLENFVALHKIPWRQIYDRNFAISLAYKANALPSNVLIDRNGKIIAVNQTGLLLDTTIRNALKK
jgi:peroxiredoxin